MSNPTSRPRLPNAKTRLSSQYQKARAGMASCQPAAALVSAQRAATKHNRKALQKGLIARYGALRTNPLSKVPAGIAPEQSLERHSSDPMPAWKVHQRVAIQHQKEAQLTAQDRRRICDVQQAWDQYCQSMHA